MKHQITEQTIMFMSIVKWTLLATITGAVVGVGVHYFLTLLAGASAWTASFPYYYLALPAAFMVSIILVKYFAPNAKGHGTEKVIEAFHKNNGHIEPKVIPIKVLATIITIAAGGSVGKEGPSAQIGSGIASLMADLLHLDEHDRKKILVCGVSAGFATVFGTPIAGAIFGIEILFVGRILYDVLLPSLVAGITGYEVAVALGTVPFHETIASLPKTFNFAPLFAAGILFGLMGLLLIKSLHLLEGMVQKIKIWEPWKGVMGGFLILALLPLTHTTYLGLGTPVLEAALKGANMPWYTAFGKILFTDLTLAFGGSGGVITPIFFIGATAGNAFAVLLHLSPEFYAAMGMVGLVAATANAPISAILMASEIFGPAVLLPAAVVCSLSFLINGHNSIYPSQILAMKKSLSLDVEVGKEIEHVTSHLAPHHPHAVAHARRLQSTLHSFAKSSPHA